MPGPISEPDWVHSPIRLSGLVRFVRRMGKQSQ